MMGQHGTLPRAAPGDGCHGGPPDGRRERPFRMVIAANELRSATAIEGRTCGASTSQFNYRKNECACSVSHELLGRHSIRSASIRYLPTKVVEVRNEEGKVERLRVEESELLEWSLVPVPADPDSVRAAARALNLPEEIFRGLEPEPEPKPPVGSVTEKPEPGPNQDDPIEALRERMDALEQQLNELAARDSTAKEEPQETPPPDPVLATVEAEFAAMRQIIEEK